MILRLPSIEDIDKIEQYKQEALILNEDLHGSSFLMDYENIEDWIVQVKLNTNEETVKEGLVPSSTFLCILEDSDELVGMIDIRHSLNEYLYNCGGHIGYRIAANKRGKGYGKQMLDLALYECRKLGLSDVLVLTGKDNFASQSIIEQCGGIFEKEVDDGNETLRRYWISER